MLVNVSTLSLVSMNVNLAEEQEKKKIHFRPYLNFALIFASVDECASSVCPSLSGTRLRPDSHV